MKIRDLLTPGLMLALCLLVFYGPILLSAQTVLTGTEDDNVGHMLISLGDPRPGGRFFHYFDLSANTRMWGQDVKYNPLHFIRLISIALGSNQVGWGILLVAVHSLLFLALYFYSRRLLQVSVTAALTGAAAAFFSISWLEWTALVYWTAGVVLLAVSIGEYGLFVATGRRRHLFFCALANVFQPYVTQAQALIPTEAYLLGAVLLMAFRRKGVWRPTLSPYFLFVVPLTILGWIPILAPVLFVVGSGLATREAFRPLTWGINGSVLTSLLGLLCPTPILLGDLLAKMRWNVAPPNSFFFGSFLFIPSVLVLWQSGQRYLRILVVGVAGYVASVIAGDLFLTPSALVGSLGFSRVFVFPLLSGFVVAAAMDRWKLSGSKTRGIRILNRFYKILLGGATLAFFALWMVNADRLAAVAGRFGWIGSGTLLPGFLCDGRILAAGVAVGLAGYFIYGKAGRSRILGFIALGVTILVPAFCFGVGAGWYKRAPELDAVVSPPSEFQFLRERIPNYEYRVGFLLSPEMYLAQGNWAGFWSVGSQKKSIVFSYLRENDLRLRQNLAFVLPTLHFFAPIHNQLRKAGNPFLERPDLPEAAFLNRRNVMVRPEVPLFEDCGVRYWLSNFDLDRLFPQKFVCVHQGKYAKVFENRDAKPVAYFLRNPAVALPLRHAPYGVVVEIPEAESGELSLHLDLRRMNARAIDPAGRAIPLSPRPSGLRWVVDVPPGSSSVLFTAAEIPG